MKCKRCHSVCLGTTHDFVNMYNPEPLPSYGNTGNRKYELNNHLGNVLMVITDQMYPLDENNDEEADGYEVGISNTFDYSPFGVQLDGRTMERMVQVCTEVTETVTAYALNETFDSAGSWTPMGIAVITYSSGEMQVAGAGGKLPPRGMIGGYKNFEVNESGVYEVSFDIPANSCSKIVGSFPGGTSIVPDTMYVVIMNHIGNIVASHMYQTYSGSYSFAFSASGTYRTSVYFANNSDCNFVVDNFVISYQTEGTNVICDTRPASYRYGFNGMEKDDEAKGKGNSYDFGARMHDPRIGRFLSIDPLASKYSDMSPYCYAGNSPILFVDFNGEGPIIGWKVKNKILADGTKKITLTITVRRKIILVNQSKMNISSVDGAKLAQDLAAMYYSTSISWTFKDGVDEDRGIMSQLRALYTHIPKDQKLILEVNITRRASAFFSENLNKVSDPEATLVGIRDELVEGNLGLAHAEGGDAVIIHKSQVNSKNYLDEKNNSQKGTNVGVHELTHLDGATDQYIGLRNGNTANINTLMGNTLINFLMNDKTKNEIAKYYVSLVLTANGINAGRKEYDYDRKSGRFNNFIKTEGEIQFQYNETGGKKSNKKQLNELN